MTRAFKMPPDNDNPYFTPDPSPTPRRSVDPSERVRQIAARANISPDVAEDYLKTTQIESGHNVNVRPSSKGALGFGQVMPDVKGGTTRTVGGRQYNLKNPDENIEAGLRYFSEGGSDPVSRRLYYFGGPGAKKHYENTGKIPSISDGNMTAEQYVKATGGSLPNQSPRDKYFTQQPTQPDPYFTPDDSMPQPQGRGASMAQTKVQPKPRVRSPQVATPEMVSKMARGGMQGQQPSMAGAGASRGRLNDADRLKEAVRIAAPPGFSLLPESAQNAIGEQLGKGASGLASSAAGLVRNLPHDPLEQKPITAQAANALNQTSQTLARGGQQMEQQTNRPTVNVPVLGKVGTQDVYNLAGGAIGSSPALILTALDVPAPVAFGLDSYLKSSGRDAEWQDVLKETGLGAATGALFEIPLPARMALLSRIGAKLGLVGGGTYGLEKIAGMPEAEARKNAAVNALFSISGAGKRGEAPKAETLTQVPDIQSKLAEREASVSPSLAPTDLAKRTALREGVDANQIEAQPNVAAQPEGTQPARTVGQSSVPRAAEGTSRSDMRSTLPESASRTSIPAGQRQSDATSSPEIREPVSEVRHVDLQPRRQRGDGKGQFKTESRAERLTRQQQVNPQSEGDVGPYMEAPTAAPLAVKEGAQNQAIEATGDQRGQLPTAERETVNRQVNPRTLPRAEQEAWLTKRFEDVSTPDLYAVRKEAVLARDNDQIGNVNAELKRRSNESIKLAEAKFGKPYDDLTMQERASVQPDTSLPSSEAKTKNLGVEATGVPSSSESQVASARSAQSKEPWQMSAREWHRELAPDDNTPIQSIIDHAKVVEAALKEGKPVPREAFAEHPELRKKYAAQRSDLYDPVIQQALSDWREGRAYIDGNGNYRVKAEGKSSGKIASWNKEAKAQFANVKELHDAAQAAQGTESREATGQPVASTTESSEILPKQEATTPPVAPKEPEKYFTPEPSTTPPKTTGVARRAEVSRRAELGQEPPSKGEGISGADSVKHGRELLAEGRSPEQAISDFKKNGSISADSMALVRAKHEELARAANQAYDEGGLDSPKFKAAEKARQDFWENSVRPMQTEWHKTGMAQQGETDIDTGTFYGLYRAFKQQSGREMTSREQIAAKDLSAKVSATETNVQDANRALVDALNKATGVKDLDPQVQKALNRFVEQSQREARTQRRQQTKKTLDEEAALIKQNIAAEFARLKSQAGQGRNLSQQGLGLLDPEGTITKAVIKLAKNRVKAGVTDTAQLIDDVHGAVKEFADVSRRQVAEVIAGLGSRPGERKQSDWMNVRGEVRKGLKAESQTQAITDAASRAVSGGRIAPEDVKTLWRYTTDKYIDKGIEFGDAVQQAAQDLKMSPDQLRHALGTQVGVKPLADATYRRMAARREAKSAAQQWVKSVDKSPGLKAVQGVADTFFNLATFGHGTVGPVTHAAENIFHPTRWVNYFKNVGRTWKAAYSTAAHERYMQDLVNDPNYTTARRAGLANEPGKFYDEYQNNLAQKMFGAVGKIGNRGFDVLKRMRQDFFNQRWEKLDETQKTPEMAQAIADLVNHSTGAIRTKIPYAGLARGVFFAPPLEASRWARILGDPIRAADTFTNWKSATPSEKYFAKSVVKNHAGFLATYLSALALNQAVLTSSGSDDKINFTNPSRSDWLRFKVKGRTIGLSGGVIGSLGLLARLGQASFGEQNPREGRFSRIGSALTDYGRGKLSPLASVGTDVITQSDFRGRPMPFSSDTEREGRPRFTWPEYALSRTSPIPISEGARDFFDEMHKQGVPVDTTRAIFNAAISHPSTLMKGVGIGTVSGSTGVRIGAEFPSPTKATDIEGQRQSELRKIERDSRSGKDVKSEIDEGIKSGVLKESDRDLISKKASLTALQSRFEGKSLPQALDAYENYNEQDRSQVRDMLSKKAAIVDTLPLASQQDIRDRLSKLGFKPGLQIPKRPTIERPERPNPRAWSYQQ